MGWTAAALSPVMSWRTMPTPISTRLASSIATSRYCPSPVRSRRSKLPSICANATYPVKQSTLNPRPCDGVSSSRPLHDMPTIA